ncbi:MAG TPA: DUF4912 domain-containing protein [Pyrinomonadaceae bacterium]|nr:DUF4912 domain-containing protein [Pyrinomonadaceae bacterium]
MSENDKNREEAENLPEDEKQKRGTIPNEKPGDFAPYSLPQVEFEPDDLDENTESPSVEAEKPSSETQTQTSLMDTLTDFADSVLESIEPVIAPIEEAIKENVIEPVLETVAPLVGESEEAIAPELHPVSSSENMSLSDAAQTSVLTKSQPYEVAEADAGANFAASQTVNAEDEAKNIGDVELDVLGIEALPALPRANRARLQVQSPNRIFLYWSLAGNPFETLQKALGNRAANYRLVLKLKNLANGEEKLSPVEAQGSWWFDVAATSSYRVDIGFFAANRPFVRLLSSNPVQTPRATPSPRVDTKDDWRVSRVQFARVLDVSGYAHDALPVIFGFGEDGVTDEFATVAVLNQLTTNAPASSEGFDSSEMHFLLSALAAGVPLEMLQGSLSPALTDWLGSVLSQEPDALKAENIFAAMKAVFGSDFGADVEEIGEARKIVLQPVFGASAIHFPEIQFPRILRYPDRPTSG